MLNFFLPMATCRLFCNVLLQKIEKRSILFSCFRCEIQGLTLSVLQTYSTESSSSCQWLYCMHSYWEITCVCVCALSFECYLSEKANWRTKQSKHWSNSGINQQHKPVPINTWETNLPSVLLSSPSTSIIASLSSSFSLWISRSSAPFLRRISSSSERSSGLRSAGTVERQKRGAKWGHRVPERHFTSLPILYASRPLSHESHVISFSFSCCTWHSVIAGLCLISFTLWCEMEMQTGFGALHMRRSGLHTANVYIQIICGLTDDSYDTSWCLEGLNGASQDRTEPNPQQLRKQRLQAETHTLTFLRKQIFTITKSNPPANKKRHNQLLLSEQTQWYTAQWGETVRSLVKYF